MTCACRRAHRELTAFFFGLGSSGIFREIEGQAIAFLRQSGAGVFRRTQLKPLVFVVGVWFEGVRVRGLKSEQKMY